MKQCGEIRMLAAVAVLLIDVVMAVGLVARDLAARRSRLRSAEHLIDQLSQAAKLHELDGNAVHPPGDERGDEVYFLAAR